MGFDIQRFPNGVDEELTCMYFAILNIKEKAYFLRCYMCWCTARSSSSSDM